MFGNFTEHMAISAMKVHKQGQARPPAEVLLIPKLPNVR